MNKQQKHDFEILKGLGMSEQTASNYLRDTKQGVLKG